MAFVPKLILPSSFLPSTNAALFAVPSAQTGAVVRKALLANTSSSAVSVSLYYVAAGGSAGTGDVLLPQITIQGNSTYIANELQAMVFNPGDALWGFASVGSAVTITVSGFYF